jgi:hypothetical protein
MLRPQHRVVGQRSLIDDDVGAAVQQRHIPQAQVNVRGYRQFRAARRLQEVGQPTGNVLMKTTRCGVDDNGSSIRRQISGGSASYSRALSPAGNGFIESVRR